LEVRQLGNSKRQSRFAAVIPEICIVILREAAESMDNNADSPPRTKTFDGRLFP
jgi:hypothetical protein